MSTESRDADRATPKKPRLGLRGLIKAMVIQRTAAVSWPEAKEMARRSDPDPAGPTDIVSDSERSARPDEPRQ